MLELIVTLYCNGKAEPFQRSTCVAGFWFLQRTDTPTARRRV